MALPRRLVATAMVCCCMGHASAAEPDPKFAKALCDALVHSIRQSDLGEAGLLLSYRPQPDEAELPPPLETTAFVYDNALAIIALRGCGRESEARPVGKALLEASRSDRFYEDGRVRNAYRAGRSATPSLLPGWWDGTSETWAEDSYQVSTATGNVVWAALALLHLHESDGQAVWRQGAERLMGWTLEHTLDMRPPAGFSGGFAGFEPEATRVRWKSTEHNIDVMAAARWLAQLPEADKKWHAMASTATAFVEAMELPDGGFRIGTTPEGEPGDPEQIVLDVQLWPILARPDAPARWHRALDLARDRLAVGAGYDFNGDRDGVWTEGTAQAALTMQVAGRVEEGRTALEEALRMREPDSGWLLATDGGVVTTGLAIGPEGDPDFHYYPRPHLGATAWAVLAATHTNPFLPREATR